MASKSPSPTLAKLHSTPHDRLCQGNFRRIARRSKLTTGYVSRAMRGLRGMSFHVAKRIADSAGVTLDELYVYIKAQPVIAKGRRTKADPPRSKPPRYEPSILTPEERKFIKRSSAADRLDTYRKELVRRAKGTGLTGRVQGA